MTVIILGTNIHQAKAFQHDHRCESQTPVKCALLSSGNYLILYRIYFLPAIGSSRNIYITFDVVFVVVPFQGVYGQGKSQGKKYFLKVRELSGNFKICQGLLKFQHKSGKSQGILK